MSAVHVLLFNLQKIYFIEKKRNADNAATIEANSSLKQKFNSVELLLRTKKFKQDKKRVMTILLELFKTRD